MKYLECAFADVSVEAAFLLEPLKKMRRLS